MIGSDIYNRSKLKSLIISTWPTRTLAFQIISNAFYGNVAPYNFIEWRLYPQTHHISLSVCSWKAKRSNRQLITALDLVMFIRWVVQHLLGTKPYQYAKCDFSAMANGTRCQMRFCEKNTNFGVHYLQKYCRDTSSFDGAAVAIQSVPQIKWGKNIELPLLCAIQCQTFCVRHILSEQIKICNVLELRAVCKWKCYCFILFQSHLGNQFGFFSFYFICCALLSASGFRMQTRSNFVLFRFSE